jgi:elongation factor Ts
MADFTAQDVQALRQATGAPMMEAKKALQEANGDQEAAVKLLRERGLAKAATRGDRENADGAVAIALTDGVAALVELKSETDFAAKADDFTSLVDELAQVVAARGTDAVAEKADDIDQLKLTKKENIELGQVERWEIPTGHIVDSYLHKQEGRGKVAVLIELDDKGTIEQAHELAKHVAFKKPRYLTRDEVPQSDVDAERETLTEITKKEVAGTPKEKALDKIVEGKVGGWFKDSVLLEQDLFDEKKDPVTGFLGDATLVRFAVSSIGD